MIAVKSTYITGIALGIALCIAVTGIVSADIPVNATFETQGIISTTSMNVQGSMMNSAVLSWRQGNSGGIDDPPLENGGWPTNYIVDDEVISGYTVDPFILDILGAAPGGEVQYTAGYSEFTEGKNGHTDYSKRFSANTANRVLGTNNIDASRNIQFRADQAKDGRMTSHEDIMVDGVGAMTITADEVLCPFAAAQNPFIPPFCNIVMSGSNLDVTLASITTTAGERFVAATADVPVEQAYSISVKGMTGQNGMVPATGSVSAFMNAHIQEGRVIDITPDIPGVLWTGYAPVQGADMTYVQTAAASGMINEFTLVYNYQSGILRV
jgi:hypothetical protein